MYLYWGLYLGKIIDINQTSDTPFMLLKQDGQKYKIAEASDSDFGFYSPIDGFSGFLRGNETDGFWPNPLTVKLITGEEGKEEVWERTFEDLPMLAIVDDAFNVYFINENGIKIDPDTGGISSIEARIINTGSAPKKRFFKEDQEIVKDELTLAEQANYNWLTTLPNAPEPDDDGLFNPFPSRIKDAHEINYVRVKELAEEWGEWTNFEEEYNSQVPFLTARDKDGVSQDVGAYDYAGGFIFDKTKLSNALDTINVFDFPKLYFVDVRQVAEELQSACTISDINSILTSGPSNEEVANNVTEVLECVGKFQNFMRKEIDGLKEKVENGEVPGLIDVVEVENQYTALVNCLNDSADSACNIVMNPYNTSFLLVDDIVKNETEYADPAELESQDLEAVLEFAAGLRENFDGPSITGASEYASGIGSDITAKINEEVEIIIVPRDSYDNIIENFEFEEKINIQIISDKTGSAKIKQFSFNEKIVFVEKTENQNAYRAIIESPFPGEIKIKASICGKTIKAFTYSNVVQIGGDTEDIEDCVPDSQPVEEQEVSLGALIEVDRVLTINIEDENVFYSINKPSIDDVASEPQTNPQVRGTKQEN